MAGTSAALPTLCPICGFDFTLLPVLNAQTHLLAHMVIYFVSRQTSLKQSDASSDW